MSGKIVHTVFRVINFLLGDESKNYSLLPIDKLILITLASHKGQKGIFPMQETLAEELQTSRRYMRARLQHLRELKLIAVQDIGRKNFYFLTFLSTKEELQILQSDEDDEIEDLQLLSQRIYSSSHRGSTDATNNKLNNKLNNKERARAKRAPLSLDWWPDKNLEAKAKEVAQKVNKPLGDLIQKFKNLQISKEKTSAYWPGEFENFLMNERPSDWMTPAKTQGNSNRTSEIKCTVPDYAPGHPVFDERQAWKNKQLKKEVEIPEEPIVLMTREEVLAHRKAYMDGIAKKQGESKNESPTDNAEGINRKAN